jgi:hypothetical protein
MYCSIFSIYFFERGFTLWRACVNLVLLCTCSVFSVAYFNDDPSLRVSTKLYDCYLDLAPYSLIDVYGGFVGMPGFHIQDTWPEYGDSTFIRNVGRRNGPHGVTYDKTVIFIVTGNSNFAIKLYLYVMQVRIKITVFRQPSIITAYLLVAKLNILTDRQSLCLHCILAPWISCEERRW